MNSSTEQALTRVRNACEQCRRKKTKCPGEKPSCSFCIRLNQKCTYTQKVSSGRAHKSRSGSQEKITRLEAQIDHINNTLKAFTDPSRVNVPVTIQEGEFIPEGTTNNRGPEDSSRLVGSPQAKLHASSFPYPPAQVWPQFVEIFRTKLYFQPFPLFHHAELTSQVPYWPPYLLQSFLAICLVFEDHPFYRPHRWSAHNYYVQSSRETTILLASEGTYSLEVLQALCLLTLCDVAAGQDTRASMNIAIASRLARCLAYNSNATSQRTETTAAREANEARCFWTVFILETAFTKDVRTLLLDKSILQHAPNIPNFGQPPPLLDLNLPNHTDGYQGSGIFSYCIDLLSIWGKAMEYRENMRLGRSDDAWMANSTYSHLVEQIYRFEIRLPQVHRFKAMGLSNRSSGDIAQYKEYWASWLLLQTTFHTTHALLNHPIFHVLGFERPGNKGSNFRPPSFVQNTIDQAILHAGWTSQLIEIANDLNIEINDPVIGHQVIVCATVHWIFSFASNAAVAERAISDFGKCQRFIAEIASRWPQFEKKANVLRQLQNSLRQSDSPLGDCGLPGFTTSLIWDLIDQFSMKSDMTAFSTSAEAGKRVSTDYLAQLHRPPISRSDEYQFNQVGIEHDSYDAPFMQMPGMSMDEGFLSSEVISELLDLRCISGQGPFGDL